MRQVKKIVLLSDENTSKAGLHFFEITKNLLEKKGLQVHNLMVRPMQDIADAIYQFDRIALEIKPDMLIVADFACITMQSPEEEPLYNNMSIPVVHVLFRRPWEYNVFMIWRCNFIDRFYMLVPEDVVHVRNYYPRVRNVRLLREGLFCENARTIWSMEYDESVLEQNYLALPDYMKTIAERWNAIMEQSGDDREEEGLKRCLREIGFACSEAEYLDILYIMRSVFPLYYMKHHGEIKKHDVVMQENIMGEVLEDFLNTDFPVSLL